MFNKLFFPIIVLILSFSTYFLNYANPSALFWDENYHIASAQKYLDGSFFMEPHPPLGKLLIAAGEKIFHPNDGLTKQFFDKDQNKFINFDATDYIKDVPTCSKDPYKTLSECQNTKTTSSVLSGGKNITITNYKDFSFVGVRFFPAFFGALGGILVYFIFLLISKNKIISLIFSSLYIFDNALVLQSRGAMLEGIQIFFLLGAILSFVYGVESQGKHNAQKKTWRAYIFLGLSIGLAISTKVNGAITYLLLQALFLWIIYYNFHGYNIEQDFGTRIKEYILRHKNYIGLNILKAFVSFLISLIVFFSIRIIHINIGRHVTNGFYQADDFYKQYLVTGNQTPFSIPLSAYPRLIKEQIDYLEHYSQGVPKLDVCKDGENGSFPLNWIVGAKAINYRRSTDDSFKTVNYLYLQSNPVIWWSIAMSIVLALGFLSSFIFGNKNIKDKKLFYIVVFLSCYIAYMISMLMITRVMYLYHYFLALIFGMMVLFVLRNYNIDEYKEKHYRYAGIFGILVVFVFFFYAPFTYYKPIGADQFSARAFFPYWQLKVVK